VLRWLRIPGQDYNPTIQKPEQVHQQVPNASTIFNHLQPSSTIFNQVTKHITIKSGVTKQSSQAPNAESSDRSRASQEKN
jgi:hypothetical protein